MNTLDLYLAAQAAAAKSVKTPLDPLLALEATLADFKATGNPNTDWPKFKNSYDQQAVQYRQMAQADALAAKIAAAPAPAPVAGSLAAALGLEAKPAPAAAAPVQAASNPS